MGEHTPGPWHVGAAYGLHGVRIDGGVYSERSICGVIGVTRPEYDKGGERPRDIDTPDGWANAYLIAAAPDLLDLALYAVDNPDFKSDVFEKMARDAIAKATADGRRGEA